MHSSRSCNACLNDPNCEYKVMGSPCLGVDRGREGQVEETPHR